MKLSKVHIQNFRSIKDLSFDVSDLCALIGPNNVGKSNILNAINFILGDSWPSVRVIDPADFYSYSDSDLSISAWFNEERTVKGDVGDPKPFTGIRFKVTRYKRRTGKKEVGDFKSEFVCIDSQGNPVEVLKRPNPKSKPFPHPASVSGEIKDELPAVMIGTDRNARYHLSGNSRSIFGRMLLDIARNFKKDSNKFQHFKDKFEEARSMLRTEEFVALEKTIQEQLRSHTGLHDLSLQMDGLDPINLYKNFSILFKDPETPEMVDYERMGSGIQSALVMSMLQAYRKLKRENAILLFEEPELFLHPHGRRHLFQLLTSLSKEGVQTIYTTHSQDFVEIEALESIRLISKSERDGTLISSPDISKISGGWQEKIKHIAEPKNEAVFAKRVIIVEGATERCAIRYLSRIMPNKLDLDLHDCSIIDAGGKTAIPTLVNIMALLSKPIYVVYDTDSDKSDADNIINSNKWNVIIDEAVKAHGRGMAYRCSPHFEGAACMPEHKKSDKPERMISYLETYQDWDSLPGTIKELMESISEFATRS